jgi:predicted transcriptional regulator
MRETRRAVTLLVLLLAACSRGPSATPSPSASSADLARPLPSPLPDVVARVNGQPIRIQQILPVAKAELDRVSVAERDKKKPEVLRRALLQYVDRELLLQEAIARGVEADSRDVDWAYDQMRREHADDRAWNEFLAGQGMDAQSLKVELRARHTVDALLGREASGRPGDRTEVQAALLARLRARARIELYL